jgi:uncharacterized membrane protein YhaH (DUF805 family)
MFKNPFSFNGRIRRLEYGLSNLIFLVIYIPLSLFLKSEPQSLFFLFAFLFGFVILFWFMLAQGAKRCHDRGNAGWWQLLPFYGLILLFYSGDIGDNEYGPNPKGLNSDFVTDGAVDSVVQPIDDVDEDGLIKE